MPKNFALIGGAGYIAPRHLQAISETGNRLLAVADPHDSVGILDSHFFDTKFFTEIERFDRYIEKLRRGAAEDSVHYVSICSPNYLHDAHCRMALRAGADAICEKPLVINPWNLDPLRDLESETGKRINVVLQLRTHPKLIALREQLRRQAPDPPHDVCLTYITARGGWYHVSWKGSEEKSGGISANIGIHLFDLLIWLFGECLDYRVHYLDHRRASGFLRLHRARVKWFLSVDAADLPFLVEPGRRSSYRSITVDGEEVEFSQGFANLHTQVYREILAGRGFGIEDARPSIDLVYHIRTAATSCYDELTHPILVRH